MINKLFIKNFQSHPKTILKFHKGLNVIAGTSDNGKTAIIRAFHWVINNKKPSKGDEFRSWWGGDTRVTITLEDDTKISRIRNTANTYKMGVVFKAIGQGVPPEIAKALNLTDINIQFQHDKFFLVASSPGEVARTLNKIVNLDKIDTSIAAVQKKIRGENTYINIKTDELTILNKEAESLKWLKGMGVLLDKVEKLDKNIEEMNENIDILPIILRSIQETRSNIQTLENVLQWENECNIAIRQNNRIAEQVTDCIRLENTMNMIDKCNKTINNHNAIILDYESEIDIITNLKVDIDLEISFYNDLKNTIDNIIDYTDEIDNYDTINKRKQKAFDKLMPDTCPLCER